MSAAHAAGAGATRTGSVVPPLDQLRFLTPERVRTLRREFGSPCFVYDERTIVRQVREMQALPSAFGLTVRYSIKANPARALLSLLARLGCSFDASSEWEARRALLAGVDPRKVSITAQEFGASGYELVERGCEVVAGSLLQLDEYGRRFPGTKVSMRVNPGAGSGAIERLTSGGRHSSFGIWHEDLPIALGLLARHRLAVKRLHHHIGSGHKPGAWEEIAGLTLELARRMGGVPVVDLGGGFRVVALSGDPPCDPTAAFSALCARFEQLAAETGVRAHLEVEPGTFLVANAGSLLTTVTDVVRTDRANNFEFLKIDAGMTEVLRTALYGAQHPLVTIAAAGSGERPPKRYVVVGHCCIAGDVLTTRPFDPEHLEPRFLSAAEPGDLLVIERAGGYCASMGARNFNSFLEPPEVLLRADGDACLVRRRQTLEQLVQNELSLPAPRTGP